MVKLERVEKIEKEELKLHIFPGKILNSDRVHQDSVESFSLWHQIWSETFFELDHLGVLFSDQFTRQDYILSLFYREQCVGLCCCNRVDFSHPATRYDSYFEIWPEFALAQLLRDGPKIIVASQLVVAQPYRGLTCEGLTLKYLIQSMSMKVLESSACDAMTGIMRKDRGMDKIGSKNGSTILAQDLIMHNVAVDLICFYRRSLTFPKNSVVEDLWNQRMTMPIEIERLSAAS